MRSSWVIPVGPEYRDKCPETEEKTGWGNTITIKGPMQPPGAGKGREDPPRSPRSGLRTL